MYWEEGHINKRCCRVSIISGGAGGEGGGVEGSKLRGGGVWEECALIAIVANSWDVF